MTHYIATTFAPVQGFIEKSRKLRDLFGSSLILSYLSQQIINAAQAANCQIISPGSPDLTQGLPNRILIKGDFPEAASREALLDGWRRLLDECQIWIEERIHDVHYTWQRDWELWRNHTWEIFWGTGTSVTAAMNDLERGKLSRDWSAVNWIGESSSLSGTDAIAWPGLGAPSRNPKSLRHQDEKQQIDEFYQKLAAILEGKSPQEQAAGKFLDPSERISIPELVKRLVTHPQIAQRIDPNFPKLESNFSDIIRLPDPETQSPGRWTGWFMGDGDKVGDHLKQLTEAADPDQALHDFSQAMRDWGKQFETQFPDDLGRIIYAGGDDFLGVIYDGRTALTATDLTDSTKSLKTRQLAWLKELPKCWETHGQNIGVSVGFVWAGHSVPQRDILQHCRESEKRSKSLGRHRVTLRVVFNSGQFVQWTCPWDYLVLLDLYCDRNGEQNWGHLYNDMAQLKARHALQTRPLSEENQAETDADATLAIGLANLYFQPKLNDSELTDTAVSAGEVGDYLFTQRETLTHSQTHQAFINWFDELVSIGWYLAHRS